ncbi:hypothetical protein [Phenylobacterium sp.]|uniref:hypothetical protein n=1 Tax=Phenylobacterium sp. TaxID=1871053 RepID=UPI002737C406|nr:hypothetical protein [Phenylobacterium sp.]MDP3869918.1 hypothetical protein [Phenylobacterium sp.]
MTFPELQNEDAAAEVVAPEAAAEAVVSEATTEAAAAEPVTLLPQAPASSKLVVKPKKVAAGVTVVVPDEGVARARPDGETRTETDAGPVQMAVVTDRAREEEEIVFPGLTMLRIRY